MKTISYLLSILLMIGCATSQAGPLTQWTLQQEGSGQTYQVEVPCTVAGALHQAGVFGENIYDGLRYKELDATPFDSPWVFTTRFSAEKGKRHVLRFEGLNYYADIDLNGKRIASSDTTFGPYCVWEFDVTSLVKRNNTLKVTLRKAPAACLNAGYVDWNPSPLDESMGIFRPVTLISTPDVQVQDVFVKPQLNETLDEALLTVEVTLVNRGAKPVDGEVAASFEGGSFTVPVKALAPGETRKVVTDVTVSNPRVWWSREMGSPEMYHMDVEFRKGLKVSHAKGVDFGIRNITGIVDELGHRQFFLNGVPVLIKGAGWTDDLFMEDTPESLKAQMEMVCDMGLNCVRFENIWGKAPYIYDLCDQMGILALVGFSCQWEWENYCGMPEVGKYGCINGPEVEALAVRYFKDQVMWLRNHPAVIGWLSGSDRIPNPRLEEQYLALYKELDYRPYVCSAAKMTSLAGPSGMKMAGPYEYVGPDYWFVDTKFGGNYGFNTETGPGLHLPQEESLRRTVGEKDLWPIGPAWAYHCTASGSHMNNTSFQENAMKGTYGEAESLQDYVRKAHALDYDSSRSMFEAFRCNVPVATGIVQWMLNSAWPSLYWQLYDWYGIPCAGYYGVKKANQPVQAVYNYKEHAVYVVNDAVEEAGYTLKMKVFDAASQLVREEEASLVSGPREPKKVFEGIQGPCFVSLQLLAADGKPVADNFYCVPAKGGDYDWKHGDWWGIPILETPDLHFVTELPEAHILLSANRLEGGYCIKVENQSDVIAYQLILKAKDAEGNLIPGTFWADNFFSLVPGESRTVCCRLPEGCDAADISLVGWNSTIKVQEKL